MKDIDFFNFCWLFFQISTTATDRIMASLVILYMVNLDLFLKKLANEMILYLKICYET